MPRIPLVLCGFRSDLLDSERKKQRVFLRFILDFYFLGKISLPCLPIYYSGAMEELLQKIQQEGDQNAFKQLYQSLFFRLYQFAFSYVRSRENAEEVVNDVFLSLWQKRGELDSLSNFNVYLYVSVKNASLNLLRKNKISTPLSVDNLVVDHLHLSANPESLLISAELRTAIRAAIEKLPPRCKIIFKLIKEDHLSYREVAAILDISVKTVDAQLCLALKKLSVSLQPLWKEYQSVLAAL